MKSGEVKLFVGIMVIALLLVGITVVPALWGDKDRPPPPPPPGPVPLDRKTLVPPGSHVRGKVDAPYTLVEFGDFQCPQCRDSLDKVGKFVDAHPDKLNYVFHFIQAARLHYHAQLLARIAEAANEQGHYWDMSDALFGAQQTFFAGTEDDVLNQAMKMAAAMKMDTLKFRAAITSPSVTKAILNQSDLADKLKVQSTPTYFLLSPNAPTQKLNGNAQMDQHMNKPGVFK